MTAHIQSVAALEPSSGGNLVMPGNATVGNTIVVVMTHSYAGCAPTITDTLGNTYTRHVNGLGGVAGFQHLVVFTAPVTTGGACTLTVSFGCGSSRWITAAEVSGLTVSPYDKLTSQLAPGSNPISTGNLTPAADSAYLLAIFEVLELTTMEPGTGWTERHDTLNASRTVMVESRVQATAAAIAATASVNVGFPDAGAWLVAFNGSGGGGPEPEPETATNIPLEEAMSRLIKVGETTSTKKRIPLRLRAADGGPTTESMTGRKAQLSLNGAASETPSSADIVHHAGTIRGYIQLSDGEVAALAVSAGDFMEARVEPDTDLLEYVGEAEFIEGEWAEAPLTLEEIQDGLATTTTVTTIETSVNAVKAKTDQLAFTSGNVNANQKAVNNLAVTGAGTPGDKFRRA